MSALAASPQSISCLVAATQKAIPGTSFSDEPEVPTLSDILVKKTGLIFIARQGPTPTTPCEQPLAPTWLNRRAQKAASYPPNSCAADEDAR